MSDDPLQTQIQFVPGVGPERARLLEKLDLRTALDVLWYIPRDVLDLTEVKRPSQLVEEGEVQTVRGRIADVDGKLLKNNRSMQAVLLDCDGEFVRGLWFNQSWVIPRFKGGGTVLFSGKPKWKTGRWEFSHPRVQWLEEDDRDSHGGILPKYGLTEGLAMHEMRRIAKNVAERFAALVPEHLPESFLKSHELLDIKAALLGVHAPATRDQYEKSRFRLLFDDLFEFQVGLALRRRVWKRDDLAPVLPTTAKIDARIRRLFPFKFTAGQDQAIREITEDIARTQAMHRLLQADVGAGKTVVALYAMLVAVAAGYQVVLMAPTEVLAAQHWETVDRALEHSRVQRLFLTGDLTSAGRREALADIRDGRAQLIVGTQAVIQHDVEFQKLGLVVIDEQHKFGVAQRARFSQGKAAPHVLVMTATPIPRSLCLTRFGDLDVTTITELPPGRQRVVTSRVQGPSVRNRAWNFIREQLRAGRQLFVVCPRIGASGETEGADDLEFPAAAEEAYRTLCAGELRDFKVALVHGKLDRTLRAETMDRFRAGETAALVSTTVIEVGVDIPNATLMVILHADRFGLSQLHQLRGRIGRGKFQGYCFLFSDTESPEAAERLAIMETTADGFRVAEADLEIRGPGDVLGLKQHGDLPLRVADLIRDSGILMEARGSAFKLVNSSEIDTPEFAPLKIKVLERFGDLLELPRSG